MIPAIHNYLTDVLRVTNLEYIGRGGFAEVYSGEKDKLPHAFKISLDPLDAKLKHMAAREFEFLSQDAVKDCHEIVQLHGWDDETEYLITWWDLCEQSLGQRLKENAALKRPGLPRDELCRFLHDAAKGIDVVNELGFRHQDIKPENLLVVRGGAKVADFGLAEFTGASTKSGSGSGTKGYMPLEAYRKNGGQRGKITSTVDIYALAATTIELATGHGPFGNVLPDIFAAQKTGEAVTKGLTASQKAAVLAALHPDPKQRPFKTATDFVAAFLDESVIGQPPRLSPSKVLATEQSPQSSNSWWSRFWSPSSPQATGKEHKSAVDSESPNFQAGIQAEAATVKTVREKAVGTRAIIIDLCRVGCVATIDDIPLLREYGRTLIKKNSERFTAGRAGQHSEEGKLVTLVLLAAAVTTQNLPKLIAAAKAKESRSTSDYAQSYRTADQIEEQRAEFAPSGFPRSFEPAGEAQQIITQTLAKWRRERTWSYQAADQTETQEAEKLRFIAAASAAHSHAKQKAHPLGSIRRHENDVDAAYSHAKQKVHDPRTDVSLSARLTRCFWSDPMLLPIWAPVLILEYIWEQLFPDPNRKTRELDRFDAVAFLAASGDSSPVLRTLIQSSVGRLTSEAANAARAARLLKVNTVKDLEDRKLALARSTAQLVGIYLEQDHELIRQASSLNDPYQLQQIGGLVALRLLATASYAEIDFDEALAKAKLLASEFT